MNNSIINVQHLSQSYRNGNSENEVLKNISFQIYQGEVIGYLGSNGAGKSTTVKILCGILSDFQGEIEILGHHLKTDAFELKKRIGYIPETAVMYEQLSPMEYLTFIASFYDMDANTVNRRINDYLRLFEMDGVKNNRMESFSKGMKQKIHIISGLLHDPEIIFMDEPLNGLDANAVILVKQLITKLTTEGKTIFYCSHLMDVVEKVATRIMLLDKGKIVADGTLQELKKNSEAKTLEELFAKLTRHTVLAEPILTAE